MEFKRIENDVKEAEPSKNIEETKQNVLKHREHKEKLEQKNYILGNSVEKVELQDKERKDLETKTNNPHKEHKEKLESNASIESETIDPQDERLLNKDVENIEPSKDTNVEGQTEQSDVTEIEVLNESELEEKTKIGIETQSDKSEFYTSPDVQTEADAAPKVVEVSEGEEEQTEHVSDKSDETVDTENHKDEASDTVVDEKTEKVENEVHSRFSGDEFKAENSFDAKAKVEHPDLNELKSKNVYTVKPMGAEVSEKERESKGEYTEEERKYIKDIRDNIDAPTTETVMQKVICVDTGNIKEDLKYYLDPQPRNNQEARAQVYGFVAKAEDAAPHTKSPQECYNNLRLDYDPGLGKENPYKSPEQSVYVIRFTDGKNYDIPYNEEFGGKETGLSPFTGNGFISAKDVTIPEYTVVKDEKENGAIVTDGEIYRINPDGKEELVAEFNKQDKCFELVEEDKK